MTPYAEPRVLSRADLSAGPVRRLGNRPTTEPSVGGVSEAAADHELGFDQGYADGLRQASAEGEVRIKAWQAEWESQAEATLAAGLAGLAERQATLEAAIARLDAAIDGDRRWAEGEGVELATMALTAMLGSMATASVVAALLRQGMATRDVPPICIRVAQSEAAVSASAASHLKVSVDPALHPGDCVLDFATGELDVGLSSRVHALVDAFLLALDDGNHGNAG